MEKYQKMIAWLKEKETEIRNDYDELNLKCHRAEKAVYVGMQERIEFGIMEKLIEDYNLIKHEFDIVYAKKETIDQILYDFDLICSE